MFEPFGLFFKVLDVSKSIDIHDQRLKQVQWVEGNTNFFLTIKVYIPILVWQLKKLARNFELIIFTFLSKKLLEDVLPIQVRELFAHIVSNENLVGSTSSKFTFKDLSLLSQNRFETGKVIIADCFGMNTCVDKVKVNYLRVKEYQEDLRYKNLHLM